MFPGSRFAAVHAVGPDCSRVVDIAADPVGGQRVKDDRGSKAAHGLDAEGTAGQDFFNDSGQNQLLGKGLGSHQDGLA
jgi:hypothetical protein